MNPRQVVFTEAAEEDLAALEAEDPRLVREALRTAKEVGRGRIKGKRLRRFGKTGDLSDCLRVYFGAQRGGDTHRIVFRETGERLQVVEVVVVASRDDDLPYLLTALRLGRLEDPVRRADASKAVARARKRRTRDQ